jgi:succinate dehydrogenase/fumarate reductase flavoprotein subunit
VRFGEERELVADVNAGICRVMQDHCGQSKSGGALEAGLRLLRGMRESEARQLAAANPHELARAAECLALLTAGEAVLRACLARRSSCALLSFQRLDFPEEEPPERRKLLVLRKAGEEAAVEELPLDWHLRPPHEAGYEENYQRHCRAALTHRHCPTGEEA